MIADLLRLRVGDRRSIHNVWCVVNPESKHCIYCKQRVLVQTLMWLTSAPDEHVQMHRGPEPKPRKVAHRHEHRCVARSHFLDEPEEGLDLLLHKRPAHQFPTCNMCPARSRVGTLHRLTNQARSDCTRICSPRDQCRCRKMGSHTASCFVFAALSWPA